MEAIADACVALSQQKKEQKKSKEALISLPKHCPLQVQLRVMVH